MYESSRLYVNNNVRRVYDSAETVHEYATREKLSEKQERCVSLLVEETVGMISGMVGDFEGEFWLQGDVSSCEIYLESKVAPVVPGEDLPEGFMASIGQLLRCSFLFDSREAVPEAFQDAVPAYMKKGLHRDEQLMMGKWSMTECRRELRGSADDLLEDRKALDMLEMSVVANLADEVTVGIGEAGKIRLVISKSF